MWGHVLDFVPYDEVLSALFINKMVTNDAVKYVRTLNFTKGYQLDVPSARRFASVEEVNCLSLISGDHDNTVLCRDTAIGLVPLLTSFPKLKEVRIAGLVAQDDEDGQTQLVRARYNPFLCSSPDNHQDLAKALCQSLLGAFKTRMLSPSLILRGDIAKLFSNSKMCRLLQEGSERRRAETPYAVPWTYGVNATGEMCETCKDVCAYFPLEEMLNPSNYGMLTCSDDICYQVEQIAKRDGARAVLRKYSAYYHDIILHLKLGSNGFCLWNAESEEEEERRPSYLGVVSKEEEELRLRLADLCVSANRPGVFYLEAGLLNDIDRLIAVGCDPKAISKEELYYMMDIGMQDRGCDVYAKTTFDALVARGFAFDEADLIVLDERIEPGLDRLRKEIRREES